MNKTQLIEKIAAEAGINRVQAQKALRAFQDGVKESLCANEELELKGFGKFHLKTVKARMGYNLQSGEKRQLPECKSIQFKPGQTLKKSIANA